MRAKCFIPAAAAAILAVATLEAPAVVAAPVAPGTVFVVASGLDNPRGIVIGPKGVVYVAEAGRAGNDCPQGAAGPEGPFCAGPTGVIAKLVGGRAVVVRGGLISFGGPGGIAATGPDGLAWRGDGLDVVMAESSDGVPPGLSSSDAKLAKAQAGRVLHLGRGLRTVGDVGGADWRWTKAHAYLNPKDSPDANPYAEAVLDGTPWVVDAGSNTLDSIDARGRVTVRAWVPNAPVRDAVPTCVAVGPDRALYIGQLTAGGNKPGAANVYRWTPKTGLKVWRRGFTTMTGCGFDSAGNFYAVEFQVNGLSHGPGGKPDGDVVKVAPNGKRTRLGVGKLFYPNGFAAANGWIYVSNWSIMPGSGAHGAPGGQVVRIKT